MWLISVLLFQRHIFFGGKATEQEQPIVLAHCSNAFCCFNSNRILTPNKNVPAMLVWIPPRRLPFSWNSKPVKNFIQKVHSFVGNFLLLLVLLFYKFLVDEKYISEIETGNDTSNCVSFLLQFFPLNYAWITCQLVCCNTRHLFFIGVLTRLKKTCFTHIL